MIGTARLTGRPARGRARSKRGSRTTRRVLTCYLDTLGDMPPNVSLFTNRLRANSFGGAASAYDAHRPRYPDRMIDDLLACGAPLILDVGAGTGIASQQFAERGADVLAVEPDVRMAAVARLKGIPVEIDTFERWVPAERTFDLVVFAASFHWVDPAVALPKVRTILRAGGRLALLWNRLVPISPTRDDFAAIYDDYMDADITRMNGDAELVAELVAVLTAGGYTVAQHAYPRSLQYSREQWLDFVFTHSNHLTLAEDQATELRTRLADRIGPDGVSVGGDALAIVATPS
jgi:SAM-dependent methyltransferase